MQLLGGPRPIRCMETPRCYVGRGLRMCAPPAAAGRPEQPVCHSRSLWPASGVSEVREHCQDPLCRRPVELSLAKMAPTWVSTVFVRGTAVRRSHGSSCVMRARISRSRPVRTSSVPVSAAAQELRHHRLGVDHRPAAARCDVGDTVLEQVADPLRRVLEQLDRLPGLDVLRQDQDAHPGMLGADLLCGQQALVGVRRRHPDVGHHHIGRFLLPRATCRIAVRGDRNARRPGPGQPFAEQHRVAASTTRIAAADADAADPRVTTVRLRRRLAARWRRFRHRRGSRR